MNGDDEKEGLDLSDDAVPDALSEDYADDDRAECPSLPGIDFSVGSADVFSEFQSSPTQEGSTKNLRAWMGKVLILLPWRHAEHQHNNKAYRKSISRDSDRFKSFVATATGFVLQIKKVGQFWHPLFRIL